MNTLVKKNNLKLINHHTITTIRKIAWNNKLNANPLANQKNILIIDAIEMIAHTSIEKDPIINMYIPKLFYFFISCSCEI